MSVSFNKNGIISAAGISESIINPFDTEFYIEPDNTVWIRLFHHNNPASVLFTNTDSFTTSVYKNENCWFNVALCNLVSKWELMLVQSLTSGAAPEKYRWIQIKNPMTAIYDDVDAADITKITASGYTASGASYGGIYKNGGNAYITGNNGIPSNWTGAVGSWTAWNNGIPGYNGKVVTTGYMDLYLRIDNLPLSDKMSIYTNSISANSIIEI